MSGHDLTISGLDPASYTPEQRERMSAQETARALQDAAYAVRHGRLSSDRAEGMLRRVEALSMGLSPQAQAIVEPAARELRQDLDRAGPALAQARAVAQIHTGSARRSRMEAARRPDFQASLQRALRHVDRHPSPEEVGGALSRAGVAEGALQALARTPQGRLEQLVAAEGFHGADAERVIEGIQRYASTAFHSRVVRTARSTMVGFQQRLERASQGGQPLDRLVERLHGPERMGMLRAFALLDAPDEADALERALDAYDCERDSTARRAMAPEIARAAAAATRAAARGAEEAVRDIEGMSIDHLGRAYELYPGAVQRVGLASGLSAARAAALSEGHDRYAYALDQAVAQDMAERGHDRAVARTTGSVAMVAAGVIFAVGTGGAGAPGVVAGMAFTGARGTVEAAAMFGQADRLGASAAAGMNSVAVAEEARTEAQIQVGVAVLAVGTEAMGLGATHHAAHGAGDVLRHVAPPAGVEGAAAARHIAHEWHE